ncbi:PREDICTED: Golgi to ER traffic protein 4 homolog [Thamnophis sirtalis]|uniref:Golgi to ER traffic protein 4 homolog n=1 Tax=Thamnophis sirtalis TaxID=35019 RepID=A0A6I9Y0F2_9SAUR|nr:PREDICTED: Golgi to ER traffic protein 4 homolog [Thamnophis sirtalis]
MAAEQEALKGGGGGGGGNSVRNRGGVQRVEGKLRASVEKGDYYEAHQMYRTLFFRATHPKLTFVFSHVTFLLEQNYCESRYHFLHSMDGEGCANMLVEYSSAKGYRSEVDMFVAQAVLQFLCLKNKTSALVVFTTYTEKMMQNLHHVCIGHDQVVLEGG